MLEIPSNGYLSFVDVMKKEAREAEERMRRLASLETVYNVVLNVLKTRKLTANHYLSTSSASKFYKCVYVMIHAAPTDHMAEFDDLAVAIGERLRAVGFHKPTIKELESNPSREFSWVQRTPEITTGVSMTVFIPLSGLADLNVVPNENHRETRYKLVQQRSVPIVQQQRAS